MTVFSKGPESTRYPESTILRAERAMRCAPFQLRLFATMIQQSVALGAIAGVAGVQNQYTLHPLLELRAESELLWLIQVGVLRREVDGQGLTNSFRVTPLGRLLVEKWQNSLPMAPSAPTWTDHFNNVVSRWLRLPI